MRGPQVDRTDRFRSDLDQLRPDYPEIDSVLADFEDVLRLEYVPLIPLGPEYSGVYVHRLDYPPAGSRGRGQFLVTFHATGSSPSPRTPYRWFRLLTISER